MSWCKCVNRLCWCQCRGECWLLFDDVLWEDNKSVSNVLVMKQEALTRETMFWHLSGKKSQCYNMMVMSMTAPAHLITLLSTNDSKLMMCWQLCTYIHQGDGNKAVKVWSEYNKGADLQLERIGLMPECWVVEGYMVVAFNALEKKNLNMIVVGTWVLY